MNAQHLMTEGRRSLCPISSSLELIGDKWSLLIIRDMIYKGKSRYNDFLNSTERISTNILSDRLIMLAEKKLITYTGEGKRKMYVLTETGEDLKPVLEAMVVFGQKHFKGSREYMEKKVPEPGKLI